MNSLIGHNLINKTNGKKLKVISTVISNSYEYLILMYDDGSLTRIDSGALINNYTIENFQDLL